jgi:hypothetical protein
MKKPFAPEWILIDEHATKAQLPLQEMKIRVPKIWLLYRGRAGSGESYWHIARRFPVSTRVLQRHRMGFFRNYTGQKVDLMT